MFKSIKDRFGYKERIEADRQSLESEAKNFKLPGEKGPQIVKYLIFAGLAFLNYRLFSQLVPGPNPHFSLV
jgi:hypothetical protein